MRNGRQRQRNGHDGRGICLYRNRYAGFSNRPSASRQDEDGALRDRIRERSGSGPQAGAMDGPLDSGRYPCSESRRIPGNQRTACRVFQRTETFVRPRIRSAGTEFQLRVWKALLSVPYGATASYKDIAAAIGSPQAVRAVGGANNRNPVPIVIPCHRIIGAGGQLVGYGGGLPVKTALLELEGWSPADVRHTSKNREWKA